MPTQPTLLITSCRQEFRSDGVACTADHIWALVGSLRACRLPMVVVAAQAGEQGWPMDPHAPVSVCRFQSPASDPLDSHVEALIEGVLFSARSPGWVWIPADMPLLDHATVAAVAAALRTASLTHAEHAQRAGVPLGVGQELYSELIHLGGYHDLQRLRWRYPAQAVPCKDPGVLMSEVGRLVSQAPTAVSRGPQARLAR